jgi:20S proteasome alpha/beta subunit
MTAVVGIYCQDGIVIGSDSSASFAHTQDVRTIEQRVKKVEVIADQVITAATGPVGLHQRFVEIVRDYWTSKKGSGKTHLEISKELCAAAYKDFASTQAQRGIYGALVAFPCSKSNRPQLCEFPITDFQPEFKNENMWFVSMGSGQLITDPFLGLMRRVFWGNTPPNLTDGIFAVTWTLKHVIELNPGGINGPQQIAVLDMNNRARLLKDDEIQEHLSNAEGAEEHLRNYKIMQQGKGAQNLPIPPAAQ